MVDYNEQNRVARAMIRWGGSFIRYLGEALIRADPINAQKIQDAFPEYWKDYLKKSKMLKAEQKKKNSLNKVSKSFPLIQGLENY